MLRQPAQLFLKSVVVARKLDEAKDVDSLRAELAELSETQFLRLPNSVPGCSVVYLLFFLFLGSDFDFMLELSNPKKAYPFPLRRIQQPMLNW